MYRLLITLLSLTAIISCNDASSKTTISDSSQSKGLWVTSETEGSKGKIYIAKLEASSGETSFGNPIILIIKCNQGKSELAINWGSHVPRGSKIPTDLRIGNEKVISSDWRILNETDTAYDEEPQQTLKTLLDNTKLIARTTYFQGGISTAYFNLEGMPAAVANIRTACHW